jgi:hypothetical protein
MRIRSILAIVAVTWSMCFAAATTQVAQAAYEVVGASGTGSDGAFYCEVCDFSVGRCYTCRCVNEVCDCVRSGLATAPGGTGPKAKSAAELQRDHAISKAQSQTQNKAQSQTQKEREASGLAAAPGGTGPTAKGAAELQRDHAVSKAQSQTQKESEAVPASVTQAATKAAKGTPRPAAR